MKTKEPDKNHTFQEDLSKLKGKLKSAACKFKSLFQNEWIWRLFLVFQFAGVVGIAYLTTTDDNRWHLFPYKNWNGEMNWDYFDSQFWTDYHENWFVTAFLFGPFLISKATDWIFAAKKKSPPSDVWKQN